MATWVRTGRNDCESIALLYKFAPCTSGCAGDCPQQYCVNISDWPNFDVRLVWKAEAQEWSIEVIYQSLLFRIHSFKISPSYSGVREEIEKIQGWTSSCPVCHEWWIDTTLTAPGIVYEKQVGTLETDQARICSSLFFPWKRADYRKRKLQLVWSTWRKEVSI